MKRIITLVFATMLAGQAWAEDFTIDNLSYEIIDTENHYVSVVGADNYGVENGFTIPSTVKYDGVTYTVTMIKDHSFEYSGYWEYITIPNTITYLDRAAFAYCDVKTVNIPKSVVSIGDMAFYCAPIEKINVASDNPKYSSVNGVLFNKEQTTLIQYPCGKQGAYTIPNSVTSICDYAFYDCHGLTSLTISNSVTEVGYDAFQFCTNLSDFNVADDNPNYSSINGVLFNKEKTTLLFYPPGKWGSYSIPDATTTINNSAFFWCEKLISITIPNSVTNIGREAFYYCSNLSSVTIPNSVTSIGWGAFSDCSSLTSATISNSLTSIESGLFSDCSHLQSVIIPNSVTSIGDYAFYGCSGLTSVTIPNSVTNIGDDAFYGCSGLTSVTIPNSVTSIGWGAFSDCSSLTSITIPNSVTSIDGGAFDCENATIYCEAERKPKGWESYWCDCHEIVWDVQFGEGDFEFSYNKSSDGNTAKLVKYNGKADSVLIKGAVLIDNTYYKITHINDGAFSNCANLKSVKLSSEIIEIGESAFNNCSSLECIDIPITVKRIGKSAFQNCTKSTIYCEAESKPDGWDSDWNYNGGKVFWNTLRQIGKNDDFVFEYNSTQDGNTAILVKYKGDSESVSVPSVIIDSVEYTVIYIDNEAFIGNKSIKTVKLPTTLRGFGKNVFKNCTALESIVIPDSVYRISENMFYGCSSLKSVGLSQAVEFIMDGAFGESGLEFIALPKTVTYIDNFAFVDCKNLKLVYIPETVVKNEANAFADCTNATIYCAAASQPETWSNMWNEDGGTVVWGHSVPADSTFELKFATKSDGTAAVASCPNEASSVNIPTMVMIDSSVYFVTGIESGVFSGCRNLNNINIEGNNPVLTFVDSVLIDKMNATLLACLTVKTGIYTIPDWVTSINSKAFMNCSNLQTVQIPKSVTQIGAYAFDGCDSLTIYCKTESKPSGWDDEWNPDNCNVIWGRFTPVIESAATAVNIYAYGNTIIVENATEEISVYNAMGMLVAHMGKGDVQPITINGIGVYIVKTGNAVKRVVVN